MSSYLYIVTNSFDGKSYVGVSKNDLHRLDEHRAGIKSNVRLQNAIKKYGIENFSFNQLEEWETYERALEAEGEMIPYLKSIGCVLYNLCDGGKGTPNPSPETRMKMRLAKLGSRSHRWGKKDTEETKRKRNASQSKSRMGKKTGPHSQEWNENIGLGNREKKRPPTENSKTANKRRGEQMKGKPTPMLGFEPWNKGKKTGAFESSEAKSARQRGTKRSEETKLRMKVSAQLRKLKKRFFKLSHSWFMNHQSLQLL